MAKRVGTWWIRDGLNDRRKEAQSFGEVLENLSTFAWTKDHGDSEVVRNDFVETPDYTEKADQVDLLYMSTHGSNQGRELLKADGRVRVPDVIDWGRADLEFLASQACKMLHHSKSNSVARWIPAFERLHYIFGFHTNSHSGKNQNDLGGRFAFYAAWHLFFPIGFYYNLRTAWKKACIETEGSSVKWANLRANERTSGGTQVDTYNERLEVSEPKDPATHRVFWTARGSR